MAAEIAARPRAAGVLADGTTFYAPIGEVVMDGSRVVCHLCGRSLRSVAAHLAAHGWTKQDYCVTFGLQRRQSLEGPETRKLRAAALTSRLAFDPAIREGSAAGRRRARSGELARDAAAAARGRPFPPQRRAQAAATLARVPPDVLARANRERADQHLAEVAARAARQLGYPDLRSFVTDRARAGASLAAMSREAGLGKDWLSRHLRRLDPDAAAAVAAARHCQHDAAWQPALHRTGFADVASYLADRHLTAHWTISAIAAEAALSVHAVESAMRRHGLARVAHATRRHAAQQRADRVAAGLGFASITAYITARRSAGWTWSAIAAESGQPPTWLRRRAAP